jgi:hypothetical protein
MSSRPTMSPPRDQKVGNPFTWTGCPPFRWPTSLGKRIGTVPGRNTWRWLCAPAQPGRSREIGDLDMAGLHIGAPSRLARGGRVVRPGGSSMPLIGDTGELLSRTFSGSSVLVNYRRLLEMNTRDSDKDALFRQEMRYPERGAGSFSNIRQADGEERRASTPVQLPEGPRRPPGLELAPDRGRSLLRRSPEDRGGIGLEEDEAKADIGNEEPEPAGRGRAGRGFPPDVGSHC